MSSDTTTITVADPYQVHHEGRNYLPGETVTVPAGLAAEWLVAGFVTEVGSSLPTDEAVVTKSAAGADVRTLSATITAPDDTGTGTFELLASTPTRDRAGDSITASSWKQPLPERIPISVDHDMKSSGVVGSGKPFIDQQGNLRVRGSWSSDAQAQRVRQLVTEGHLTGVSVEFIERQTKSGGVQRDLLGASIVYSPMNPDARVLAAKGIGTDTDESDDPASLVQSIHDAAVALGAQCGDCDPPADPASGESEGTNKGMSADRLTSFHQRLDALLVEHPRVAASSPSLRSRLDRLA